MTDEKTLAAYADNARDYATRFASDVPSENLTAFMDLLPNKARVLDLGCGPANATLAMRNAGFNVDAWDASPDMAAMAKEKFNVEVRVATFDELSVQDHYEGIYANFSLLHCRKSEIVSNISRIADALKPNGVFHLGMKTGSGEKRDRLGRLYAYYTEQELEALVTGAGLALISKTTGSEEGLDGTVAPWAILLARKP